MTYLGTRPILQDELRQYELHHRARIAIKPGMRKSIDGLCAIIQEQFSMEIDHALFLFCGRRCDRIKAILKEPDGIVMIYKRLTAQGSYRWPRNKSEVRNLTWREFDWLMSGIDIEQPKAIKAT
mgnify:CR=1 FL=1